MEWPVPTSFRRHYDRYRRCRPYINPNCIVAGPSNNNPYKSPTGTTLWAGGTQATCTATFNSGSTTAAYTIKFTASGSTINTDYPNQLAFTIGGVTYTMVSSLTGAPPNSVLLVASGSASTQETDNAKNLEAAINNTSSQCTTSPCFNVTAANPLATATESTSTVTITAKTAGYAGNFSVSLANVDAFFQVLEVATLSQTAAGSGPGYVNAVTITNAGSGYGPQAPITFTGGAGSGAMALANTTPGTGRHQCQPAYGAAPGWDMATGLGSPNANVLVNHCLWTGSCNAGTTTGVSSSTNPSNYGQSVSFTATSLEAARREACSSISTARTSVRRSCSRRHGDLGKHIDAERGNAHCHGSVFGRLE